MKPSKVGLEVLDQLRGKLSDQTFWDIIKAAKGEAKGLKKFLKGQPTWLLRAFNNKFAEKWAAYCDKGMLGSDSSDYAAFYTISRGKKVYEYYLKHPEQFDSCIGDNEMYSYVVMDLLEERGEDNE